MASSIRNRIRNGSRTQRRLTERANSAARSRGFEYSSAMTRSLARADAVKAKRARSSGSNGG